MSESHIVLEAARKELSRPGLTVPGQRDFVEVSARELGLNHFGSQPQHAPPQFRIEIDQRQHAVDDRDDTLSLAPPRIL